MSRMKKVNLDRLADAELDIMKVLWNTADGAKVSEIIKELSASRSWKTSTAHVLLGRLEEHGYVTADRSGYYHKFYAKISEKEYFAIESDSLRRRIGGNFNSLIASLIDAHGVTEADIDEISQILQKKRSELKEKEQ